MANHKSALKRAKQNELRELRNRSFRTRIKSMIKKVNQALEAKSPEEAKAAMDKAQSLLDKGASRGVIHKNKASRKISRLAKKVRALAS